MKKQKKWRRRYQYTCTGCGKQRFTLNWGRKVDEKCTICQKNKPNENQLSLFKPSGEKEQILELIDKHL